MSEQAKKLTAAQRKVLERLAAGDVLIKIGVTTRFKFQGDQEMLSSRVCYLLGERELIQYSGQRTERREAVYALTDSGRAALVEQEQS